MKRYLLDTNHLSNALHVKSAVRERILQESGLGSRFATCWPALCELEAGLVQLAKAKRHRRMLIVVMGEVRVWPMNWDIVKKYGVLFAKTKAIGRPIGPVDLMLAAIAFAEHTVILTSDQDFRHVPEIRTENWIVTS